MPLSSNAHQRDCASPLTLAAAPDNTRSVMTTPDGGDYLGLSDIT